MAIIKLTTSIHGETTEYGIRIEIDGRIFREYPAVTTAREEAERLLHRLSEADLSALHYDDVVRDYILELAYEKIARNGCDPSSCI